MKNLTRPPVILPEQFKLINAFFKASVRRYHYAIYFELLAYPRMKGERVRQARLKDINVDELTVCGVPVLDITMNRLIKYLVRNGINMPSHRMFKFSRQIAQVYFKKALKVAGVPPRATISDFKEAFNTYLRIHCTGYKG